MKKDKEWLKEEIKKLLTVRNQFYPHDEMVDLGLVLLAIDQLDEPETLSQEWIDENKVARINNVRKMTTSDVVPVEKLKNLIVPKQDKPIIPQFVAEYIEYYKGTGITLGTWFNFVHEGEFEKKTEEWIYSGSYDENLKREYLLIDAIRYGYEVNKEKKYYIYDKSTKGYLGYNADKTRLSWYTSQFPNDVFTEQEIKEIDERYWAFAQEVKE